PLKRGPEDYESEGFDVLPAADPRHVIAHVSQDELRLIKACVVQLIDNPVLSRMLPEMGGSRLHQRHHNDCHHETRDPTTPDVHSSSSCVRIPMVGGKFNATSFRRQQ